MTPGIPDNCDMDRGSGLCPAHPFITAEISAVRDEARMGRSEILVAVEKVDAAVSILSRQVYEHHAFQEGQERAEGQSVNWHQFGADVMKWGLIAAIACIVILILKHADNIIWVFGGKP